MHTKYVLISVLTVITYMMDKYHSVSCMSVLTRTWYLCPQLIKDPIYLCQQIQYTVFIKIAISYSPLHHTCNLKHLYFIEVSYTHLIIYCIHQIVIKDILSPLMILYGPKWCFIISVICTSNSVCKEKYGNPISSKRSCATVIDLLGR